MNVRRTLGRGQHPDVCPMNLCRRSLWSRVVFVAQQPFDEAAVAKIGAMEQS
jgi:hypothetical protein